MKVHGFAVILFALIFLQACVPQRKYQDVQSLNEVLLKENAELKSQMTSLQAQLSEMATNAADLQTRMSKIVNDTSKFGADYRRERALNQELNSLYEQVVKQNKELLTNATSTSQKLSMDLDEKRRELERKQAEANALGQTLEEREARVRELEGLIAAKDSAMNSLKRKVMDALAGFEKSDLTVETRADGNIYVSLSEKLLFKSGSTAVDPKGVDAIKKVAEVLAKNTDIAIRVEGHTDNVPLKGSGDMKDNWDLSVLRATNVAKIIQNNGVTATRIIASGRGESMPIADNTSTDGKARNRRTEIILSPDLSKLYQVLGTGQ
ncbi:MAG TPA: OmpA family protein [Chitinophagales bacterium]|nr:OmpA family protein [Chitinophagales bacterium]